MSYRMSSHTLPGVPPVPLNVCVFGGARPGHASGVLDTATRVGELLGTRGHRLIYGAGGVGVMGAVAHGAAAAGAPVTGVIPRFLYERERAQQAPAQELVLKDDLFDRKRYMIDEADGFLALPGGYGTLDEVLEVVSMQTLGLLDKPCVLLDVDGSWDSLVTALHQAYATGFADRVVGARVFVAATPDEAVDLLELDVSSRARIPRVLPALEVMEA